MPCTFHKETHTYWKNRELGCPNEKESMMASKHFVATQTWKHKDGNFLCNKQLIT
jgi:hypothetical protein